MDELELLDLMREQARQLEENIRLLEKKIFDSRLGKRGTYNKEMK